MDPRRRTLLVSGALTMLLTAAGFALPVPYIDLRPGGTFNTLGEIQGQPLVSVTGRETFPVEGHLDLTTVDTSGERLTLATALQGWLDNSVAIVPREVFYPSGQTDAEIAAENVRSMEESQELAKTAALRQLDIPVPAMVSVAAVTEGSPAAGQLQVSDVITMIDGQDVRNAPDLVEKVTERAPGDQVAVGYQREGAAGTVRLTTAAAPDDPQRAVIGVLPQENDYLYPFEIAIQLDNVGGPSAGLMFALGIIDRVTPGALTGGAYVAGTGTIDASGTVGPIGGIQQKLIGARGEGATVFLVPAGNCEAAVMDPPDGLRLVRVETLDGAVVALDQLRTGTGSPPLCES